MKILADSSLPGLLQAFPPPFELSFYQDFAEIDSRLSQQQILLCRSTLKVNQTLLASNSSSLRYVATASSGTDHVDKALLQTRGITLLDAKGSNAPAVADYVIACLAYLEKCKRFSGKRAGVIGLGKVGNQVAQRLNALGLDVFCYDPLKAMIDKEFKSCTIKSLFDCDLLCIHANLHDDQPFPSRNFFDEVFLGQLKSGVVLINAARGGIVDEQALAQRSSAILYCTDVYEQEPDIDPKTVEMATLCTPHIAGHSIEAKDAAVALISQKLHQLYQLPAPHYLMNKAENGELWPIKAGWQDRVLALYNPLEETQILKNAKQLGATFQTLRKAHHFRHNFTLPI